MLRLVRTLAATFIVSALLSTAGLAADTARISLATTMTADTMELTVPVSKLILSIPRGNLQQVDDTRSGARANPRYFMFRDEKIGLIVSGWFESDASWPGFDKFIAGEMLRLEKDGQIDSADPVPVAAEPWQAVAYDKALPGGVNANVRAELVRAGTWVDLHISVTGSMPPEEARTRGVEFLKNISIKVK